MRGRPSATRRWPARRRWPRDCRSSTARPASSRRASMRCGERQPRCRRRLAGNLPPFAAKFFRFVAVHGEPGFTEGQFAQGATRPAIGVTWPRIVGGERFVHIVDVMDSNLYRAGHEGARRFVEVGGGRSLLTVALRKDEALLG